MRILTTFFLALIFSIPAHAARLSLVGMANSSEPQEPGTEYTGVPAYGAGLLLEFHMVPMIGFEIGALYVPRTFYSQAAGVKITSTGKFYEFPVLLRAHLGRILSLGMGGYYAQGTGDTSRETEENGVTSVTNYSYSALHQTKDDYGLVGSLALAFRLAPLTRFLLDGRYTLGIKNNSTAAGGDRKYDDMQLLAGLQFGF